MALFIYRNELSLPKSSPLQPSDNGCPRQQRNVKMLELPGMGMLVILLRGRKITSYLGYG